MEERRKVVVVVSGVPDVLPADTTRDKLTIHFQSPRRSCGGDVDCVTYPTDMDGVAFVTFDRAEDADRVLLKEEQIMTDSDFPDQYLLTVFPFSTDIFFLNLEKASCVNQTDISLCPSLCGLYALKSYLQVFMYVSSATVDLFLFGSDQASLIRSLRSAHRTLRFQPCPEQRRAAIQGPFAGVQALRADLISRASRLNTSDSVEGRVASHREPVGSESHRASEAKPKPGTDVQIPLSDAKTQKSSSGQKLSCKCVLGSNSEGDIVKKRRDPSRLQMPTEDRTNRVKTKPRQALGKESNTETKSRLSRLDLLSAEETLAEQPPEYDISHLTDRISTTSNIRRDDGVDCLKESKVNLVQTRPKDVSQSSQNNHKDTEELPAVRSNHPEDVCVMVDSYVIKYIEKYDQDEFARCLGSLKASVRCVEGTDLMRISWADERTPETAQRVERALENLNTLVEYRLSVLRVHEIPYDSAEQPEKLKLLGVCTDVGFLFDDVLYVLEDSCVKVIGPSPSSHLFRSIVTGRMTRSKAMMSMRR